MLTGKKTMTTRSKKYGDMGDTFEIFGQKFIIKNIVKLRVGVVAYTYYDAEGLNSPEEFIEIWKKIHPMVGFQPDRKYWAHIFIKVEPQG